MFQEENKGSENNFIVSVESSEGFLYLSDVPVVVHCSMLRVETGLRGMGKYQVARTDPGGLSPASGSADPFAMRKHCASM